MIFSNKISKFGRGYNISAYMSSNTNLKIYFYNSGIMNKNITIEDNSFNLTNINVNLPYNALINVDGSHLVTRLNKSIGIINEE